MADQGMSDQVKQLLASARDTLRPIMPPQLRGDIPVVPVVLNVPYTVKRAGRHRLDVVFDYDGSARCSVPFAVIGP